MASSFLHNRGAQQEQPATAQPQAARAVDIYHLLVAVFLTIPSADYQRTVCTSQQQHLVHARMSVRAGSKRMQPPTRLPCSQLTIPFEESGQVDKFRSVFRIRRMKQPFCAQPPVAMAVHGDQ